jgi:hypothetical protein
MKKQLPPFNSHEDEARFWEEHSVMEFVDEGDVSDYLRLGGNKSVVVTLRLEPLVREQTRRIARDMGNSYQALMREWIYDGLRKALEAKYGTARPEPEPLVKVVQGLKRDIEDIKAALSAPQE